MATATALSVVEPRDTGYTDAEWRALKSTMGKEVTDADFTVFVAAARQLGLDPIARQVRLLKIDGQLTIYTTIEGLRVISERHPQYGGMIGPQWCGPDGEWRNVWLEDGPPAAARVGIIRRDWDTPLVWGVARWKSYAKDNPFWRKYQPEMLAKVAESIARRITSPNETRGMYVDAELASARDMESVEADVAAQVPEVPKASQPQPARIGGPDAQRIYEQQRVQDVQQATPPVTQAPDRWVTLHGRIRGVQLATKREADALCRQACGKTWEQCNTDRDYAAIDKIVTKLEQARDAEAQQQAESLAQSALVGVQEDEAEALAAPEGEVR